MCVLLRGNRLVRKTRSYTRRDSLNGGTMLCQARQMPSSASPRSGDLGSQASARMCPGSRGSGLKRHSSVDAAAQVRPSIQSPAPKSRVSMPESRARGVWVGVCGRSAVPWSQSPGACVTSIVRVHARLQVQPASPPLMLMPRRLDEPQLEAAVARPRAEAQQRPEPQEPPPREA